MSRSKDEELLLEERIERIKKRNEEIKRRHLEVEADKQNAAKLNALVQPKALVEDWTNERSSYSSDLRRSQQSGQAPSDSSSYNRTTPHSQTPREGRHLEQTANISTGTSPKSRKSVAKTYTFGE
ncbi:unnamed protein product, partial [Timema podura]|nr:unnamed protein product [Timema podura]